MFKKLFIIFLFLFLIGPAFAVTIDNFENNNYTSNPVWTVIGTTGGIISVQGVTKYNGSYGLKLFTDGANDNAAMHMNTPYSFSGTGTDELNFWVQTSDVSIVGNSQRIIIEDAANAQLVIGGLYNNAFQFYTPTDEETLAGAPVNDTWYLYRFIINKTASTADLNIYDTSLNLLQDFTVKAYVGTPTKIALYTDDVAITQTSWYVDAIYDNNVLSPIVGIYANFDSSTDVINSLINLTDTSTDTNTTINDWNWTVNGATTLLSNANLQNPVINPVTEYTDYNTCLSVGGIGDDGNNYTDYLCKTVSSGKFYGDTNFFFYDELTQLPISATIDFNGTSYTGTTFSLPTKQITNNSSTNSNFVFTITKTSYGTRYYQVDLNQFSDLNVAFGIIADTNSLTIPLKVYKTDETTLFTNTYVELYRPDKSNLVVGRRKTNASGETTFSLNNLDQNYYANINNGEFIYQPVMLTILYPKNEETLVQIDENWQIDITNNLYVSYTELNISKIIYLIPNTADPFNIKISDMNGNYFARTYAKQYPGNPLTDTLQPYLVSTTTGLLTTITTLDASSGNAVPSITIKIYKYISGLGRTLVEQVVTDSKGQALSLLVLNGGYEFECYQNTILLDTFSISATSNTIFIYLDLGTTITNINTGNYSASWMPSNLSQGTGNQEFTQTIYNPYGYTITVNSSLTQDGTNLDTPQTWTGSTTSYTFTYTIAWTDLNSSIESKLVVYAPDGNILSLTKNYEISDTFGSNYNILWGLQYGLREDLGYAATGVCLPLLVVAVLVSIGIGIYVSMLMGAIGSQSVSVLFGIVMALFTFLNWVPIELMGVVIIIIIAFMVNERR